MVFRTSEKLIYAIITSKSNNVAEDFLICKNDSQQNTALKYSFYSKIHWSSYQNSQ